MNDCSSLVEHNRKKILKKYQHFYLQIFDTYMYKVALALVQKLLKTVYHAPSFIHSIYLLCKSKSRVRIPLRPKGVKL